MSARTAPPRKRRANPMTFVWALVLGTALAALGAGFASGSASVPGPQVRTMKFEAAAPVRQAVERQPFARLLRGAHSLANAGDALPADTGEAVDVDRSRRPADRTAVPRLAIVLVDCDPGDASVNQFVELPIPLTLAIAPDADGASELATRATAIGHAVLAQLPAFHAQGAPVARSLAQVPGALGAASGLDPFASVPPSAAKALAVALRRAGMVYLDTRAGASADIARAARHAGVPVLARDIAIDARDEAGYVAYMLHEAAELAFRHGDVVAIAHARPATYDALRAAGPRLVSDGIQFTRLNELLH